jgi:RHS repeat-associated protein
MITRRLVSLGHRFIVVSLTCLNIILVCSQTYAQSENVPDRGFQPAASYALSDIETINSSNGNLLFHIPLVSLPPGRGGAALGQIGLYYNSKLWETRPEMMPTGYPNTSPPWFLESAIPRIYTRNRLIKSPEGGWRYGLKYELQLFDHMDEYVNSQGVPSQFLPNCGNTVAKGSARWKLKMAFPDGSVREFRPLGFPEGYPPSPGFEGWYKIRPDGWETDCIGGLHQNLLGSGKGTTNPLTYYTVDGTFLKLIIDHDGDNGNSWPVNNTAWKNNRWTLYMPDGARVVNEPDGIQRIYDRNNNFITIINNSVGGAQWVDIDDPMSRRISLSYNVNGTGVDEIKMSGFGGEQAVWKVRWQGIIVTQEYFTEANPLLSSSTPHSTQPCEIGVIGIGGCGFNTVWLTGVDQIELPAQGGSQKYLFDYNSGGWGQVNSVTLPTGAKVDYQFFLDGRYRPRYHAVVGDSVTRKDLSYGLEYDGSDPNLPENRRTETWTFSLAQPILGVGPGYSDTSTITAPDGGVTTEKLDNFNRFSRSTAQPDGTVIERIWRENKPYGTINYPSILSNPYVATEFRSIKNASGSLTKTAIKDFKYDKNGNLTQVVEYDWVAYGSVPRDSNNHPTGIPSGLTPSQVTVNTYHIPAPDATDNITNDPDVYHRPESPNRKRSIASSEVRSAFSAGSVLSRTEFFYDNPGTTGNLTVQRSWDSTKGGISVPLSPANSISVAHQYDSFGNITRTTDAKGVQTQFIYDPINDHANLYVTQTKVAAGTPVQRWATQAYDFHTGLVTQSIDMDNNITTETSYDVFGRPVLNREASGTAIEKQTATEYSDINRRVITHADLNTTGDGKLVSIRHYDQLGRIRLVRTLEDAATQNATDETHGIKVQTRFAYSGPNSFIVVSAPYRANSSAGAGNGGGMGWTRSKFNSGGLVVEVESFGGGAAPFPWGGNSTSTGIVTTQYDAEFTIVTDQAGKRRRNATDALGRLTKVFEDPSGLNYLTDYSYDALGNLLRVRQGSQTRTMAHNSLSRLISTTDPESGTVTYAYDPNGNLIEKTDARGVRTTITYDALNRITSNVYSGITDEGRAAASATKPVFRFYDNYSTLPSGAPSWPSSPSKGRLIGVTYGTGSEGTYHQYDALGRIVTNHQRMGTSNYVSRYTYNLANSILSEHRGSPTVDILRNRSTYDAAGRLTWMGTSFTPFLSESILVKDITYTPFGALQSEKYGNGLIHSMGYNNLHQPTEMRLGRLDNLESIFSIYNIYGTANNPNDPDPDITLLARNNGNIARIKYYISGTLQYTQTHLYDPLNRLKYSVEYNNGNYTDEARAWYQTCEYDFAGNRGIDTTNTSDNLDGTNTALRLAEFSSANNRITRSGYLYDSSGNLTAEPDKIYTYDAEHRLVKAVVGGVVSEYVYDGFGQRVKKTVGGVGTRFEYGLGGKLIGERNDSTGALTKAYFYRSGELIAITEDGTTHKFATSDHLGTPRAWTDRFGDLTDGGREDYAPFGQQLTAGIGIRSSSLGYGSNSIRQKFTGKEKDDETGLHFFGARYYSSVAGRFTSVDKGAPDALSPQSWNRYSYVRNNPLSYIDPDGNKDEPALNQKLEQAMARLDPTLYGAIKASTNISQRKLEEHLWSSNLTRMKGGFAYNLIGATGEAFAKESYTINPAQGNLSSLFPVLQPVDRGLDLISKLFGINMSLPSNLKPDLFVPFVSIIASNLLPRMTNILATPGGATKDVVLPNSVKFGLVEVKAGFGVQKGGNPTNMIKDGVQQIVDYATALKNLKLPGVAILMVDAGAWRALSPAQQTQYLNQATAAGAYIQVIEGLAVASKERALDYVRKLREEGR